MSYNPPPPQYGLPQFGPPPPDPYPQPAPPKKSQAPLIAAIVVGGVVVLCLGMVAIGALLPGTKQASDAGFAAPVVSLPAAPSRPAAQDPVTTEPTVTDPTATSTSDGTEPKRVKVPDLVGQNAAIADEKLRKLGFTNIRYGSRDKDDTVVLLLSNWTVTKQSTKAGKSLSTDSLIVLTCTKDG